MMRLKVCDTLGSRSVISRTECSDEKLIEQGNFFCAASQGRYQMFGFEFVPQMKIFLGVCFCRVIINQYYFRLQLASLFSFRNIG